VSSRFRGTERYDAARHDTTGFSCGNELLDRWLIRYARQNERRDAARTFIAATDDRTVYGYYTLVAGQLEHDEATPQARRGLSRHFPIPVAILARLAIHSSRQGQGLGATYSTMRSDESAAPQSRWQSGRWSSMPSMRAPLRSMNDSASRGSVPHPGH
jgi:hypothetical protein